MASAGPSTADDALSTDISVIPLSYSGLLSRPAGAGPASRGEAGFASAHREEAPCLAPLDPLGLGKPARPMSRTAHVQFKSYHTTDARQLVAEAARCLLACA
jgi:hypothetical protein